MSSRVLVLVVVAVGCSKSHRDLPAAEPAHVGSSAPTRDAGATGCVVSMLVDDTAMWIGTTAGSCRALRHGDTLDWAWEEAELVAIVRALGDECSPSLEIASISGHYQDLIHAMDVSVKVGIVDVGLSARRDLVVVLGGAADGHCKAPPKVAAASRVPDPNAPQFKPVIGSNGEITSLEAQAPLNLPEHKTGLQQAPVIIVTRTEVLFEGTRLSTIDAVPRDEAPFVALRQRLDLAAKRVADQLAAGSLPPALIQACADAKRGIRPRPGSICPEGLAILQADAATDVRVINTIVRTAKAAGFDNLLFAVKDR